MKWIRFFPQERDKAASWLINFKTVLGLRALELKLDPERVAEITTFVDSMIDAHTDMVTYKKKYESARDEFKQKYRQVYTAQGGLAGFIGEIKGKPDYNDGIGAELGIIGHSVPIDYLEYKPKLKAIIRGTDDIELRFSRYYSDEVAIYGKRGNEPEFSLLATVNKSPYFDTRPNLQPGVPEVRYYKIVLKVNYKEVSRESNIAELKVWNPDNPVLN